MKRAIAVVSETVAVQACHHRFPDAKNEGDAWVVGGASARRERVLEDRDPVA